MSLPVPYPPGPRPILVPARPSVPDLRSPRSVYRILKKTLRPPPSRVDPRATPHTFILFVTNCVPLNTSLHRRGLRGLEDQNSLSQSSFSRVTLTPRVDEGELQRNHAADRMANIGMAAYPSPPYYNSPPSHQNPSGPSPATMASIQGGQQQSQDYGGPNSDKGPLHMNLDFLKSLTDKKTRGELSCLCPLDEVINMTRPP